MWENFCSCFFPDMEQHTGMAEAYSHRTHTTRWREREMFFCWFRKCVFFFCVSLFSRTFSGGNGIHPGSRTTREHTSDMFWREREKFKSSPNIMHLHGLQDCINQSHSRRVFLKINQTSRWIFTFHLALAHPYTQQRAAEAQLCGAEEN